MWAASRRWCGVNDQLYHVHAEVHRVNSTVTPFGPAAVLSIGIAGVDCCICNGLSTTRQQAVLFTL